MNKKLFIDSDIIPDVLFKKTVDDSLVSNIADFEDGFQYFSAKENKIPVIITRNIKDYKEKGVTVQTAEEYVKGWLTVL